MDTNRLLRSHNLTEPAMFQLAVKLSREGKTEDEIIQAIRDAYEIEPRKHWAGVPKEYSVFGTKSIPENVFPQMDEVMSIPPAERGALMPDAHLGYAMPIGGVVAMDNAVSPSFVGYDIACRMMLSLLDITPDYLLNNKRAILNIMQSVSSFGIGSKFDNPRSHPVMNDPLWDTLPNLKELKPRAQEQLGSSGGGNHFFDALIGKVVESVDWLIGKDGKPLAVGDEFTAIMTHSGSRGTGYKTATFYQQLAKLETQSQYSGIPKGYEWLSLDSEAGKEYWAAMQLMGKYAQANHTKIHYHFARESGITPYETYENHHNFAWVEDGSIVHRKGATPANKGEIGIIPGSSGTPSFLVEGLGHPASLNSSSHGAGRPFSRTEAKRRHDEEAYREHMDGWGILTVGVSQDETLQAYKDISEIIAAQEGTLVRVIARLYPEIVIMGGKADDGD